MNDDRFLFTYGIAVALLSLAGWGISGAPTSLIGVAFGGAIAVAARPTTPKRYGKPIALSLTVLLLVQAVVRLVRGSSSPPPPDFGQMFFAILAAMSLTALLVTLAGRRSGSR